MRRSNGQNGKEKCLLACCLLACLLPQKGVGSEKKLFDLFWAHVTLEKNAVFLNLLKKFTPA